MFKEYLPYLAALGVLMLLHSVAGAGETTSAPDATDSPATLIQTTVDQLLGQLEDSHATPGNQTERLYLLVNDIVVPHLDMSRIARIVLGKYVRRIDATEFAAFKAEFQTLLVRTYATSLAGYSGGNIDVLPAKRADNGTASVQMNVHRPGSQPVAITFLTHNRNGPWLVYDIRIEGISLVTNYRSEFAGVLSNTDFEGLMTKLRARNRQPQLAAK